MASEPTDLIRAVDAALAQEAADEGGPIVDDPAALVGRLRDALVASEAALAEAEERIDTMIEKGVEEGMFLKSLTAEDGTANLSIETKGAAEAVMLAMLDGMADQLDKNNAENYVEFELVRRGKRPVTACVRWLHHPTPHELRVQAEGERDEARAALAEANATIERVRALHRPTSDDVLPMFGTDPGPWCVECSTELSPVEHPCDTIRAIEEDR